MDEEGFKSIIRMKDKRIRELESENSVLLGLAIKRAKESAEVMERLSKFTKGKGASKTKRKING